MQFRVSAARSSVAWENRPTDKVHAWHSLQRRLVLFARQYPQSILQEASCLHSWCWVRHCESFCHLSIKMFTICQLAEGGNLGRNHPNLVCAPHSILLTQCNCRENFLSSRSKLLGTIAKSIKCPRRDSSSFFCRVYAFCKSDYT